MHHLFGFASLTLIAPGCSRGRAGRRLLRGSASGSGSRCQMGWCSTAPEAHSGGGANQHSKNRSSSTTCGHLRILLKVARQDSPIHMVVTGAHNVLQSGFAERRAQPNGPLHPPAAGRGARWLWSAAAGGDVDPARARRSLRSGANARGVARVLSFTTAILLLAVKCAVAALVSRIHRYSY